MASTLRFYVKPGSDFNLNTSGSGLGFFGDSGYGATVSVGSWQGTTFITDGNGLVQGAQGNNIKFINAGSGTPGAVGSGIGLKAIPNHQASLNIRFENDSPVRTQNAELRIYDRSSINNGAVGVTTKVAEIIHPDITQGPTGSGDDQWLTPAGSAVTVAFAPSPATSGQYAGDGVLVTSVKHDIRHDWYAAISASPDSIGAKTSYGLYFSCEFL